MKMKEFWFGEKHWILRNEIFDWCEQNFGPYGDDGTGLKRWIFYSDGDVARGQSQRDMRIHLFLNDADAIWFKLKWDGVSDTSQTN